MNSVINTVFSFLLFLIPLFLKGADPAIKAWEVFEITLKSIAQTQNPYVEFLKTGDQPYLTAIFTCTDGRSQGKIIKVPGFWDGNNTWKIRFTPPAEGNWSYETVSQDRKMNRIKGRLIVSGWSEEEKNINPVRRGFMVVNGSEIRKGRYFTYSDGTPVL